MCFCVETEDHNAVGPCIVVELRCAFIRTKQQDVYHILIIKRVTFRQLAFLFGIRRGLTHIRQAITAVFPRNISINIHTVAAAVILY
ncbi:hypothetical protein SDC9_116538 [bioreactor metagenome]|uniref:Uncharacterized protein n=1 Tax=bioreactor metagenome TaxID=1076179 RepID=A0A645BVX1_9ZZZZ